MKKNYIFTIIFLLSSCPLSGVLFIAHRVGLKLDNPENSLAALNNLLLLQKTNLLDAVEFDVGCTRDKHPMIMHDHDVNRTTNGKGSLCEFSLEELQKITLTDKNGKPTNEKIPTLTEFLDTIDNQLMACIELKCQEAVMITAQTISYYIDTKGWSKSNFTVISFQPTHLEEFSKFCPTIKTGFLLESKPDKKEIQQAQNLKTRYIIIWKDFLNKELIAQLHGEGLEVVAYIVNDHDEANKLIDWGIDGIASDDPMIFPTRSKL